MIRRIVPWILLLLAGCRSNGPSSDGAVKELRSNEGANTASGLAPYSLGRWRLVPPEELTRSVLWVSHILVRHAGSDRQVPGSVALWRLEPPPAGRTRAEALVLAERVASEAQRAPEQFAALARQYSEDVTTRDRGGSLGGVRASDFLLDPEALDALAALRPGEVSRVVETAHGLLIFQRRAPVAPDTVTGVHVVIGHDDTHWLANVGAPSPQRSREQARALALDVYEQARTNPEGFSELVARYSEHPDRNEGGDIGSWSTREPTIYPRAVQALEGLKVGEIAPPIESYYGFEIVQRIPNRPRPQYAIESLRLHFDAGEASSKTAALERAREWLESSKIDAGRFDELRQQYRSLDIERWVDGQAEEPGLDKVVAGLKIGELASQPVVQYSSVVIARRVDPTRAPPVADVSFELPSPEQADLGWLLTSSPIPLLRHQLLALTSQRAQELGFTPEQRQELDALSTDSTPGLGSEHAASEFLARVRVLLGGEKAGSYENALVSQLVESRLENASVRQSPPPESPARPL